MKKYSIILLILLSACSALKKPETSASVSQNINNAKVSIPDTTVSANQNSNFVAIKKFNGDTLGYLQQNFINNKQKYVGKDLNTLLNDCEIPIKSFFLGSASRNEDIVPDITLEFYTFSQATERTQSSNNPIDIIIEWSQPLPTDSVYLLIKKNKCEWTEAERKYFGKQIIGNILTTNWKK